MSLRGTLSGFPNDVNEVSVRSKQYNKSVNIFTGIQTVDCQLSLLFLNAKERNTSLRFRAFRCLNKQTTYRGVHFKSRVLLVAFSSLFMKSKNTNYRWQTGLGHFLFFFF